VLSRCHTVALHDNAPFGVPRYRQGINAPFGVVASDRTTRRKSDNAPFGALSVLSLICSSIKYIFERKNVCHYFVLFLVDTS
jgi:hypothetical protein